MHKFITHETVAHATYNWDWQRIDVRLFEHHGMQGVKHIGLPVTYQQCANDGTIIEPTAHLTHDQAQQLMDSLWDCGIRPTQGHGSAGQLDATQKHLNDMRAIAFHTLELTVQV